MELKLGVSMFWILINLLLLVYSRITPKCAELQSKLIPDRCLYDGNPYHGHAFCNYDNKQANHDHSESCCFKTDPGTSDSYEYYSSYRFQVWHRLVGSYKPQNTLRYTDQTLAQEGRSFCLVGEHFYQTQLLHWKNFRMFRPLAERLFDIGNHIDPDDSRLMNVHQPFDTDTRFSKRGKGFKNLLTTPALKEDFKEVYCGTKPHPEILHPPYGNDWETCGSKTFPYDTLEDVNTNTFRNRPPINSEAMDPSCRNPYKVLVTRIDLDGLQLKNYLHIKVYTDAVSPPPSGKKCPTGKMKYVMLEVRDQDGFPVGQFTNDIPCDTVVNAEPVSCPPSTAPFNPLYGSKKNFMPCMFSHRLSSEAPSIFLAGVEGGSSGGGNATGGGPGGATPGGPGGGGGATGSNYFTEVHATWRFAQMSSHLITELHFAAMIVEDERPIRYYTSRMTDWDGVRQCGFLPQKVKGYEPHETAWVCCENGNEHRTHVPCPNRAAGWKSTQHGTYKSFIYVVFYQNNDLEGFTKGWTFNVDVNPYFHCGLAEFCSLNFHVNGTNNTDRPYGFSAQYKMIKLKKESLGGWGYFQCRYIRDKDVNCHKDIPEIDPYFEVVENYPKGRPYARLPPRRNMFIDENYRDIDGPDQGELEDYMTPGRFAQAPAGYYCNEGGKSGKTWAYIANNPQDPVRIALKDIWNDPAVVQNYYGAETKATEYFGTRHSRASEATPTDVPEQWREELSSSLKEMVQRDNTRCPCPFVPTTEEPELQTKAPVEVQARHLHVVNMLIAWIILVPLAFFVGRYYKETFSKVFFLQEFWWYTIHVLALLTALLFMVGSFYSMHLRREGSDYKILWTDATTIHIYFGYTVVGVFVIHLLLGPFRFWDRDLREMQIWLHWGFGWAEYILAAFTFASAAGMPQGLMNCESFGVYVAFLFFQVLFYAIMEKHSRVVDKRLDLEPPRRYFPVHSMRIFHKDAPGSVFRIVMLIAYFLISIAFYAALHILTVQNPNSCFQKQKVVGAVALF